MTLRLYAAALAFALVSLVVLTSARAVFATQSNSTIGLLALDANVQDNTATSLGPIEGCARVETGAQIDVDYVVDSVPEDRPIIAFEVELRYDPQLVEPVALDHKLLLASAGSYSPFTALTDALPDSDGTLRISVLDAASRADPEANVERGAGVLARITFLAKAAGVSEIAVVVEQGANPVYPLVQDSQNETQAAATTDPACIVSALQEPAPSAIPSVAPPTPAPSSPSSEGQPTPSPAAIPAETPSPTSALAEAPCTPKPTPKPDEIVAETGGSDTGLMAGALALLVLGTAAGGGGWYLLRRSPSAAPTNEPPADTTPD